MWEYLAGIFDARGFIKVNLTKDKKGRTEFNVYFNFTDNDKNVYNKICNFLNEQGIKSSIYFIRRKKGWLNEYHFCITNRRDTIKFLERIYPYSLKKDLLDWAFEKYSILKAQGRKRHY